jgi:hypothetical protein
MDLKKVDAPPWSLERTVRKSLNGSQSNATQILENYCGAKLSHYPRHD